MRLPQRLQELSVQRGGHGRVLRVLKSVSGLLVAGQKDVDRSLDLHLPEAPFMVIALHLAKLGFKAKLFGIGSKRPEMPVHDEIRRTA